MILKIENMLKLRKKSTIVTTLGTYHRALETPKHIYFVNHQEGDENGSCKMFDRKMKLVSDNYFAHAGLTEDLTSGGYNWISKEMRENVELYNNTVDDTEKYILK
jgi:hypothetical protein